jgi:hypothetical protein
MSFGLESSTVYKRRMNWETEAGRLTAGSASGVCNPLAQKKVMQSQPRIARKGREVRPFQRSSTSREERAGKSPSRTSHRSELWKEESTSPTSAKPTHGKEETQPTHTARPPRASCHLPIGEWARCF